VFIVVPCFEEAHRWPEPDYWTEKWGPPTVTLEVESQVMGSPPIFWQSDDNSYETNGCELRISDFQEMLKSEPSFQRTF